MPIILPVPPGYAQCCCIGGTDPCINPSGPDLPHIVTARIVAALPGAGFLYQPNYFVGLTSRWSYVGYDEEFGVHQYALHKWRDEFGADILDQGCTDVAPWNADGECTEAEVAGCFQTTIESWKTRNLDINGDRKSWDWIGFDSTPFSGLFNIDQNGTPTGFYRVVVSLTLGRVVLERPPGRSGGPSHFCYAENQGFLQTSFLADDYPVPPGAETNCELVLDAIGREYDVFFQGQQLPDPAFRVRIS